MSLPLKLRWSAERDLVEAQRRYEQEESRLGKRFRTYVDEAIERVRAAPDRYPFVHGRFRRILVRRPFPYSIYYSVEADRIVIVACLHEKRHSESILRKR